MALIRAGSMPRVGSIKPSNYKCLWTFCLLGVSYSLRGDGSGLNGERPALRDIIHWIKKKRDFSRYFSYSLFASLSLKITLLKQECDPQAAHRQR